MLITYYIDLIGVAFYAIAGSLLAARLRMDPFGVLVLASLTAVGGGTLRDILLGVDPVFWIRDPTYLIVLVLTSIATMFFAGHFYRIPNKIMLLADAVGLGFFCVLGAQKAIKYDAPFTIALVMGIMTGVAGGIIRDVLCRQIPLILRKEIYATACMLGSSTYIVLIYFNFDDTLASIFGMIAALSLRVFAIFKQIEIPVLDIKKMKR